MDNGKMIEFCENILCELNDECDKVLSCEITTEQGNTIDIDKYGKITIDMPTPERLTDAQWIQIRIMRAEILSRGGKT